MISWAPEQINCGENQMWAKIEAETLSFFLVFLNISCPGAAEPPNP